MRTLSHILLNPRKAERHPFEMFVVGFFYASISVIFSLWLFPDEASVTAVFLSVISCLYVVQGAMLVEERREIASHSEGWMVSRHFRTLSFLMFLFVGFVAAFTLWAIILPAETGQIIFESQQKAVTAVWSLSGYVIKPHESFMIITENNLRLLLVSLAFAAFYGAGAVFILAWNASVMGFVMGNLARGALGLSSLPLIVAKYFLHGIPEILAYFIAALAGGIIFIAIVKGDALKPRIKHVLRDLIGLVGIAVLLLIIAGLIESYLSPLL